MLRLVRTIDRMTGYAYMPQSGTNAPNSLALLSSAMGEDVVDVDDIQERWGERKGEYDRLEAQERAMLDMVGAGQLRSGS
jgi:hypothetical protein